VLLAWPQRKTAHVHIFLKACAPQDQATRTIVLLDHGRGPTAKALRMPEKRVGLCVPPSRPALHPSEPLGQEGKAQLAWLVPIQIDALA